MAYLDDTGLAYFWGKIKAWAQGLFALIGHTHPSSDVTAMTGYSKPSSSSAIAASDTLNQAVGKLEKGMETADGNAVHKTGDETVAGEKTFTGPLSRTSDSSGILVRNMEAVRGTVPQNALFSGLYFCDASGAEWDSSGAHGRMGCVEVQQAASGGAHRALTVLASYDNVAGSQNVAILSVGYDDQGRKFAQAPQTDPARGGASDILTRSWDAAYLVHKSGTETISGDKTFTHAYLRHTADHAAILQKNTYLERGTTPAASVYDFPFYVNDKNDKTVAALYYRVIKESNNLCNLNLICYDYNSTGSRNTQLGTGYDENGNPYAFCASTRTDRSNGADILTRDWIPNDTRIVHTDQNDFIDSVKAFGANGWLMFHRTMVKGTNPSVKTWFPGISWQGSNTGYDSSNASRFAAITASIETNGTTSSNLIAYKYVSGSSDSVGFSVNCETNGYGYTSTGCTRHLFSGNNYEIRRNSSNSATNASMLLAAGSNGHDGATIQLFGRANASYAGKFYVRASTKSSGTSSGNTRDLVGTPDGNLTWYGQTIQTSSDERLKTPMSSVPDGILDAWGDVRWGQFKFLDAVAEKGDSARLHAGLIAQAVQRAFGARGLDACAYGALCHEVSEGDANNPPVDLWTVRYAEALCMEAAYMRRENDRLKKRVSDLEERLAALELRLGSE